MELPQLSWAKPRSGWKLHPSGLQIQGLFYADLSLKAGSIPSSPPSGWGSPNITAPRFSTRSKGLCYEGIGNTEFLSQFFVRRPLWSQIRTEL